MLTASLLFASLFGGEAALQAWAFRTDTLSNGVGS